MCRCQWPWSGVAISSTDKKGRLCAEKNYWSVASSQTVINIMNYIILLWLWRALFVFLLVLNFFSSNITSILETYLSVWPVWDLWYSDRNEIQCYLYIYIGINYVVGKWWIVFEKEYPANLEPVSRSPCALLKLDFLTNACIFCMH